MTQPGLANYSPEDEMMSHTSQSLAASYPGAPLALPSDAMMSQTPNMGPMQSMGPMMSQLPPPASMSGGPQTMPMQPPPGVPMRHPPASLASSYPLPELGQPGAPQFGGPQMAHAYAPPQFSPPNLAGGLAPRKPPVDVAARGAPNASPSMTNLPSKLATDAKGLRSQQNQGESAMLQATDDEKQTVRDAAVADAQAASDIGDIQRKSAHDQEIFAANQANRAAIDQAKTDEFMRGTTTQLEEYKALKVDPNRTMRDKSALSKVAMAIGGMLGGISASLNHGPNEFLAQMNHAIDRDIAAQEKEIATKGQAVAGRGNILAQMMQADGNAETAKIKARLATVQAGQNQIEATLSYAKGATTMANGQKAIAALEGEKGKLLSQLAGYHYHQLQTESATRANAPYVTAKRLLDIQKEIAETKKIGADTSKLDAEAAQLEAGHGPGGAERTAEKTRIFNEEKDQRERWNPVIGGFFTSKAGAEEFGKQAAPAMAITKLLQRAKLLKDKVGRMRLAGNSRIDDETQELEEIAAEVETLKPAELNSGVMRKFTEAKYKRMVGDIADPFVSSDLINRTAANMETELRGRASGLGFTTASPEQVEKYGGRTEMTPIAFDQKGTVAK